MAAIYSNGGNRWNILGFNFTKRDALCRYLVYIRYLWVIGLIKYLWVIGLINVYTYPLDNFQLQYPSTNILS
jgi:hypothetical protein